MDKDQEKQATDKEEFQQLVKVCNWLVQEDMKQNPSLYFKKPSKTIKEKV
jgi:hypothetical protein